MTGRRRPLADRFWDKVDKTPTCWLWRGAHSRATGYGNISNGKGVSIPAHRVAYELEVGPIPAGLSIDHLCRVHNCVNPDHLEPVTPAENSRRMAAARTDCYRGLHPMSGPNLGVSAKGIRYCRECRRNRQRERRATAPKPQPRPHYMRSRTHCPQGHPYDEANTYHHNGRRSCRRCAQDRKRAARRLDLVKNPGYVEKWREASHGDGTLPVGAE